MSIVRVNHDIQYVSDQFSCTNYMTAYITKNEAGKSDLLEKTVEECRHLPKFEAAKRLGGAVDKGRELSIQEGVYRASGQPMSKFSRKVKYLNTSHPNMRDGLLKSNYEELNEEESVFHLSPHDVYESRPDGEEGEID